MIRVNKDYDDIPSSIIKYKNEIKKYLDSLESNNSSDNVKKVRDNLWKKLRKEIQEKLLEDIYHKKCAYCESKFPLESFPPEIDHYRPILIYPWLAFEWSNLFITCKKCNNKKGTKFETKSKKINSPPKNRIEWDANSKILLNEKPLLLNPEIDNPDEHLTFMHDGTIIKKNNSERGKKTIEICCLDREPLTLARKKIIDDYKEKIKDIYEEFLDLKNENNENNDNLNVCVKLCGKEITKILLECNNPKKNYSLFRRHIHDDYENLLVNNIIGDKNYKDYVLKYLHPK